MTSSYLLSTLENLLEIPSPCGMCDAIVEHVALKLSGLGIESRKTRRGALCALFRGKSTKPALAFSAHLDTLGAMVQGIRDNGRPLLTPIGNWSARFAEGARVSVHLERKPVVRGSILPRKASGHRFNHEVDNQPSTWENLELRLDADTESPKETLELGIQVGDMVSIDPQHEFLENGYLVSRFLDNKAAVAVLLTALSKMQANGTKPERDIHLIFSVSEEIGTGAGHMVAPEVADLVTLDIAVNAQGQNAHNHGVTIVLKDAAGPYDRSLSRQLLRICQDHDIVHSRDVFRHYFSDAHSAALAGADCRMALACFACDSSHGWERTHVQSLLELTRFIEVLCGEKGLM
jgi:peptidase M42 family hydrolase